MAANRGYHYTPVRGGVMTWEALVGIGLTFGTMAAWGVTFYNENVTKFEIYRAIAITVAAAAWCIILGI